MRNPDLYAVKQLKDWSTDTEIHAGVWVPARPMGYPGIRLWYTFKLAFGVLIGKYDAVEWYKQ